MKLKKVLFLLTVALVAGLTSCATQRSGGGIPYEEAHNYFFRNDAKIPLNPVCTTQEEFGKLYGAAALMGKGGMPTKIDFDRQFVIGIVLPETNDETTIIPGRLTRSGDTLTMEYSVKIGERNLSYTTQPVMLLVVDKKYKAGKCVLRKTLQF